MAFNCGFGEYSKNFHGGTVENISDKIRLLSMKPYSLADCSHTSAAVDRHIDHAVKICVRACVRAEPS